MEGQVYMEVLCETLMGGRRYWDRPISFVPICVSEFCHLAPRAADQEQFILNASQVTLHIKQ